MKFEVGNQARYAGLIGLGYLVSAARGYNFNYELGAVPNRQYEARTPNLLSVSTEQWATVPLLDDAPTSFQNLPAGCTCLDEQQTAATCTAFVCHETCNLNHGQCDAFCCSDPDCTAEEIARFKSTGTCLEDGKENNRVTMCTDATTLDKVNIKYNMYVDSDDDPLSGILCVSVNNDPFDGNFYVPQTNLINNVALLNSPRYQLEASFQTALESSVSASSNSFYIQGGGIVAATALKDGSLQSIWGGFLSLQTVGPNGECVPTNYVEFGQFVQSNKCVQPLGSDLEAVCSDPWSPFAAQALAQGLRIGATPLAALSSNVVGDWVTVEVGSVSYQDPNTGLVSDAGSGTASPTVASPTVASPSVSPTQAPQSGRRVLPAFTASFNTEWDAASSTCMNALVGARFVLSHDSDGVIVAASVELTVSDIAQAPSVPGGAVMQDFQVDFININATAGATAASTVPRVVSGNPGYIQGLPVQAGNQTQDGSGSAAKTAVEYAPDGLSVMAASGARGACFASGNQSFWWDEMASGSVATTPVLFGVDTVSTCTVELTYNDFLDMTTWCKDWSETSLFSLSYPLIGVYGNADPLKLWDWVPINFDLTGLLTTEQSPMRNALMCKDIIESAHLEILWTKSGQTSNPQAMILSARQVLGQANWRWQKSMQANTTQTFTFSQSVTFIEHELVDEDTIDYKPEVGAILPQLSYDIFYPFDIDNGAAPGKQSSIFFVTMLALWMQQR